MIPVSFPGFKVMVIILHSSVSFLEHLLCRQVTGGRQPRLPSRGACIPEEGKRPQIRHEQQEVPGPPGRSRVKEEVSERRWAWRGGALRPSKKHLGVKQGRGIIWFIFLKDIFKYCLDKNGNVMCENRETRLETKVVQYNWELPAGGTKVGRYGSMEAVLGECWQAGLNVGVEESKESRIILWCWFLAWANWMSVIDLGNLGIEEESRFCGEHVTFWDAY